MTDHALLTSRRWTLTRAGWVKRGWAFLQAAQARACEEWCEFTYGAVPSRENATAAELREIRKAVEANYKRGIIVTPSLRRARRPDGRSASND